MSTFNAKSVFQHISRSDVLKIATLTSLIFVILHFIRITLLIGGEEETFFYTQIWNRLCLPLDLKQWLYQPWTLLTYMFMDMSFMRILGNMIWLWVFATVIEDLKGSYRILPIYLSGGILGALLMLTYHTLSPQPAVNFYGGALAALVAVVVAVLLYKPTYRFWFFGSVSVPIWVLALIFLVLNLVSVQAFTLGYLFLMIGGALVGVLYNYGLTSFFDAFTAWLKRIGSYFGNNDNFVLKKNSPQRGRTEQQLPYRSLPVDDSRIDAILDKINEKGIHSLSEQEKRILNEYSKKV